MLRLARLGGNPESFSSGTNLCSVKSMKSTLRLGVTPIHLPDPSGMGILMCL